MLIIDNSSAIDVADGNLFKVLGRLENVKGYLQSVSEECFNAEEDRKQLEKEMNDLRNQLQIVDKNHASLQLSLAKLRGKQETHRARAIAAVC